MIFLPKKKLWIKTHYTESNDKPSAQQSNEICSESNDRFEYNQLEIYSLILQRLDIFRFETTSCFLLCQRATYSEKV